MPMNRAKAAKIGWMTAIVAVSASLGMIADWNAPGIGRYARDWMMRARGRLPVPEDIAIVAIDEASMARFGGFPWSRQVMARTIDVLGAFEPKVIALDVLYTDPTSQEDDDALARSIGRAGNVVVAAQLTDAPEPRTRALADTAAGAWNGLRPAWVTGMCRPDPMAGPGRLRSIWRTMQAGRSAPFPSRAVRVGDGAPETAVTRCPGCAARRGSARFRWRPDRPGVRIEAGGLTRVQRGERGDGSITSGPRAVSVR